MLIQNHTTIPIPRLRKNKIFMTSMAFFVEVDVLGSVVIRAKIQALD
jgi:hypothetical protein